MKISVFLALILISILISSSLSQVTKKAIEKGNPKQLAKLKKLQCKFRDQNVVFSNYSCYVKTYAKKISTMNMYFVYKEPLKSLHVSIGGEIG